MKKLIAVALSLMLLFAIHTVFAEDGKPLICGDYKYTLFADQTAEIIGYKGFEENLVIPDHLDGHRVVSIGSEAFYECEDLISVVLPEGLTTIAEYAFYCCSNLSSVSISDSVTFIGKGAFFCADLLTVTIPDGIQTIEGNPFDSCVYLKEITIKADHPIYSVIDNALVDKRDMKLACYPVGLEDEEYTIPQGILSIGDYAFTGSDSLTKITIPDGVTSIGRGTFMLCTNLTTVALPDSLTSIGKSAFDSCWYLENVTIPDSVTIIGEDAFYDCEKLTLNAGRNAYAKEYAEANGIKIIAETINETPKNDDYEYVPLTQGTAKIVKYKGKDIEITIPESINGYKIVSIGRQAFFSKGLKSVSMPDSITTIEDYAFSMNRNLEEVSLSKNLQTLGEGAFCMTNLKSVTFPDSIETMYGNPFQACGALSEIVLSPKHPKFILVGNALFDTAERKLILYLCSRADESYEIPEGTLSIGDYAFRVCEKLITITLPDSIRTIGKSAFDGCEGLTQISIPKGVKNIEEKTFQGCESLTEVIVPDGVTSIGDHAFRGCKSLTSVTIPDSVERISDTAFFQSENVALIIGRDSYAMEFAEANGIPYSHPKVMDWISKWWK